MVTEEQMHEVWAKIPYEDAGKVRRTSHAYYDTAEGREDTLPARAAALTAAVNTLAQQYNGLSVQRAWSLVTSALSLVPEGALGRCFTSALAYVLVESGVISVPKSDVPGNTIEVEQAIKIKVTSSPNGRPVVTTATLQGEMVTLTIPSSGVIPLPRFPVSDLGAVIDALATLQVQMMHQATVDSATKRHTK